MGVARRTRQEDTGVAEWGRRGKAAPPYPNSKTYLLSREARTFEIEASRLKLYLRSAAQKTATPKSGGRGIAAAPSSHLSLGHFLPCRVLLLQWRYRGTTHGRVRGQGLQRSSCQALAISSPRQPLPAPWADLGQCGEKGRQQSLAPLYLGFLACCSLLHCWCLLPLLFLLFLSGWYSLSPAQASSQHHFLMGSSAWGQSASLDTHSWIRWAKPEGTS